MANKDCHLGHLEDNRDLYKEQGPLLQKVHELIIQILQFYVKSNDVIRS